MGEEQQYSTAGVSHSGDGMVRVWWGKAQPAESSGVCSFGLGTAAHMPELEAMQRDAHSRHEREGRGTRKRGEGHEMEGRGTRERGKGHERERH